MAALSPGETATGNDARRRRKADLAALCLIIFFLATGVGLSTFALWNELVASQSEALAADAAHPGGAPGADAEALPQIESLCIPSCRPSVRDAAAAVRLAAAATLPADQRGPLLSRALHDLKLAQAAEPLNGPVSIHLAYAATLVPDPSKAEILGQIERSYRIQPFSKAGGLWRVGVVARNWAEATPAVKRDALREAVWLPSSGTPQKAVDDLFDETELGVELDLARRLPPP